MSKNFPTIKIATKKLVPYANNSRTHSTQQIAQIVTSIKEFGFTNPVIVDEDNTIIAGHGRVLAAQQLNMVDVPCVQVSGWTDAQKKAYVIADNKLALNAGWNDEVLKIELGKIEGLGFDLEKTGFSLAEIKGLGLYEEKEGLTDEDAVPEPPKISCTIEGDIWMLGNHRVMCGDSMDAATVSILMGGGQG